jgi:hypothetical protein
MQACLEGPWGEPDFYQILTSTLLDSLLQKIVSSISKEAKAKWGWGYSLDSMNQQPKLLSDEERKTRICDGGKGLSYNSKEYNHNHYHNCLQTSGKLSL